MTNHSPIPAEFPQTRNLSGQKLPPPKEDHNLLGEHWGNTGNLYPPPNRGGPQGNFLPPPPEYLHPHSRYAPPNLSSALAPGVTK